MRYPSNYPLIMSEKIHTLIVVDIETTGLDTWRNEILTWSMSAVDYFTLERKDSIELTFRPKNLQYWDYQVPTKSKKPRKKASEIHGISLSQALYFEDKHSASIRALEFISKHCNGDPQIMVCHAFDLYRTGNFLDVAFIMIHLEKLGMRWELYKHIRFFESTETYFREARLRGFYRSGNDLFNQVDEDDEGRDFKLGTLCKHYKITLNNHHTAQDDREACESLYRVARGLGDKNDEESEFDLHRESDGDGISSRESEREQLQDRDGWGYGSHHLQRIEEDAQTLQEEHECERI